MNTRDEILQIMESNQAPCMQKYIRKQLKKAQGEEYIGHVKYLEALKDMVTDGLIIKNYGLYMTKEVAKEFDTHTLRE